MGLREPCREGHWRGRWNDGSGAVSRATEGITVLTYNIPGCCTLEAENHGREQPARLRETWKNPIGESRGWRPTPGSGRAGSDSTRPSCRRSGIPSTPLREIMRCTSGWRLPTGSPGCSGRISTSATGLDRCRRAARMPRGPGRKGGRAFAGRRPRAGRTRTASAGTPTAPPAGAPCRRGSRR